MIEIGELVVDGRLADLVRVVGDADTTQIYLHPIDAPAFVARWAECGRSRGRLH